MKNKKGYLQWMGQGLLFGLLTAVVFIGVRAVVSDGGALDRKQAKLSFESYVTAAYSFQKRNFDFKGVCSDAAFPDTVLCVENIDTFKIEMQRPEGGYYCADSSGFNEVLDMSSRGEESCN